MKQHMQMLFSRRPSGGVRKTRDYFRTMTRECDMLQQVRHFDPQYDIQTFVFLNQTALSANANAMPA
jgi:hypothetical protein